MNILLICQSDSVITKASGNLIPVLQRTSEVETHWANVEITKTICFSLVLIVLICTLSLLALRLIDHHAKKNVDVRKREWDKEDKDQKQKSELLDRKLEILKELCYENKDDKAKKVILDYSRPEIIHYLFELGISEYPRVNNEKTISTSQPNKEDNHE